MGVDKSWEFLKTLKIYWTTSMQTTKFVVIITRENCFKCQTDKLYQTDWKKEGKTNVKAVSQIESMCNWQQI